MVRHRAKDLAGMSVISSAMEVIKGFASTDVVQTTPLVRSKRALLKALGTGAAR